MKGNWYKMRNIKILGLALVAMFSMSAVMAVSASADTLTASSYPAVLTGTADEENGFKDTFTTTAGTVKCPDTHYDGPTITGPLNGTTTKVIVTPTYPAAGCTGFGFPATIHHGNCNYEFKVLAGTAGTVNLECSSGELTITAIGAGTTKCTVHVPSQTDIPGTISYKNVAGGKITVEANLTGLIYKHTAGTGVGACPNGSAVNGTFTAKAFISAQTHAGVAIPLILS